MRGLFSSGMIAAIALVVGTAAADPTTPTDFTATYVELEKLTHQLEQNGLEVLGTHQVAGSNDFTVVVYTSEELQLAAAKPGREFAAVLRILHNRHDRKLVASNPEYYLRAFLQKDYTEGMAQPVYDKLVNALGELTPTSDALKTKKLPKYRFMIGMPRYEDFTRVAKGTEEELCRKLEENAGERIVFKLALADSETAVLYGVALPPEIEGFNEKLGTMGQSHLLPYTVLVQGGEANILHAKFYLALSFPQLTMTEFMRIRSVPGDIKDAFKADFE